MFQQNHKNQFITLRSFPQAILHIDADAFFASVAQAIHPKYKGKPLVTGAERGIIAAASYEAKALGIKRGVTLQKAKQIYPQLIVLPTDYETCSLFSKRMFDIIRQFTPLVEEYSIDEAFADITGLRRVYHCSYEQIAQKIKHKIDTNLGITVSVGLSLTKSLAKICSDFRKPSGLTAVKGKHIHILLKLTKLQDIWGIGTNTAKLLQKNNINNALEYAQANPKLIKKLIGKLGIQMHEELNGKIVYNINPEEKSNYQTISKFKTFSPATNDKKKVKSFLLRNLESACIKARRHKLAGSRIHIILRTQNYQHYTMGIKINRISANTLELTPIVSQAFNELFQPDQYRATGIILTHLETAANFQLSIFDNALKIEKMEKSSQAIDSINHKYGKHSIHVATSLNANQQHQNTRNQIPVRKKLLMQGENNRQRLAYPMMMVKV